MELDAVMQELESYGNEQTRKIYTNHGVDQPMFGVKVGDMKKILKKTKKDHALALELFSTGNADAQYLAALMGNEKVVSPDELDQWVQKAYWNMVGEYGVGPLAAESPHGWDLGLKWIEDGADHVSAAGWSTLSAWVSIRKDEDLDLAQLKTLLNRVADTIHDLPNRTRYTANNFVVCVGSYVSDLLQDALDAAKKVGKVSVNLGNTSCKVPVATDYLQKMIDSGRIGKKRKKARC